MLYWFWKNSERTDLKIEQPDGMTNHTIALKKRPNHHALGSERQMSRILMEICCGSADDVIQAEKGGADRVELNSNLFQGGLTPSIGMLEVVKRYVSIPVMTMVRPRAGGFCYTDVEFETAKADARTLLLGGADGLVFGFLHEDGTVDEKADARNGISVPWKVGGVSSCAGRNAGLEACAG